MYSSDNYDDYNGTDGIILMRDIPNTLIPYSSDQMIMSAIAQIIVLFGVSLEVLLLVSCIFKYKRSTSAPNTDTKIVMSVLIADILFCSSEAIHNLIHLAHGGWSTGIVGCRFNTNFIILSFMISISSLVLLALNRYLAVCHNIRQTQFQCNLSIGAVWLVSCCLIGVYNLPSMVGKMRGSALMHNRLYCFLTTSSPVPLTRVVNILVMVIITVPLLLILYAYSSILVVYFKSSRKVVKMHERNGSYMTLSETERLLISKCASITGAYILCFMPYLIKMVYEIIHMRGVSLEFDNFAMFTVILNPPLNTILSLWFDIYIRTSTLQLLGLENWYSRSRKNPNSAMVPVRKFIKKASKKRESM